MSTTIPARGIGSVTAAKGIWWRRYAKMLVIGCIAAVVIIYLYIAGSGPQPKKFEETLKPATELKADYAPAEAPAIVRVAPKAEPVPQATPAPAVTAAQLTPPSFTMKSWHLSASGQLPVYMQPKPPAAPVAPVQGEPVSGIAYKAETMDGAQAFVMKHPELVLPQWSSIPCILETGIITGVSGVNPFRCRLPSDVSSPTGVVLMEKGTIIGGTYQSVVAEGQARIVAVSANARTPNNVVVPLGGPMADGIGQAGVEGTVDNHWMQRIGGALVLTLLDAGTQVLTSALQSHNQTGGNSLNFGSGLTGSPFAQTAERLLDKTLNIPPTITLKQGVAVTLWTTRFTDFSKVYALQEVR